MRPLNRLLYIGLLLALILPIATPAQAYLDPGTGTMILQIILGGVAGLVVAGRLYWDRLKAFLGFSTGDATTNDEVGDTKLD